MIKIDTKKLEELKTCSDFATNREAEKSLLGLLEAKKQLDTIYDEVRESLKQNIQNEGLDFVEGDLVKVSIYQTGFRYKLVNKEECPPEVLDIKLNPSAVDAYLENNNKLPEGVEELETRSTGIRITTK